MKQEEAIFLNVKNYEGNIKYAENTMEKIKIILVLAMPAVIENFFQSILGFVDHSLCQKLASMKFRRSEYQMLSCYLAGNVEVFSYMIGYGFATAATILVGQQIGAGI